MRGRTIQKSVSSRKQVRVLLVHLHLHDDRLGIVGERQPQHLTHLDVLALHLGLGGFDAFARREN